MKRRTKKKKQTRRKTIEDDEIDDGLKQSKIEFIQLEESEEENLKKSQNSNQKVPILSKIDLKNGTKNKNSKKAKENKIKKKRSRPKTEEKCTKSKSKKRTKTKPKVKKTIIKKGVDYIKGKYNIRVKLIEKDTFEEEDNTVNNSCCVVCSNRNCVRAAKTQNYELMNNCIKDRAHISTLINPYSISIGNAIEIAIENEDKK